MRIDDVREALASLERRMDQRFIGIDQRFVGIDQRLDSIDARFGRVYALLIAMLIAIVGGMSGIVAAILQQR